MTLLDAIDKIHAALTGLANALETGDADRVLAAEQPLAEATASLESVGQTFGSATGTPEGAPHEQARLTDEVHLRARLLEARLALERCRALGDASAEMLNALHPNSGYERTGGQRRLRDAIARAVNSQV